jgi:hypothetical protein
MPEQFIDQEESDPNFGGDPTYQENLEKWLVLFYDLQSIQTDTISR